MFRWVRMVMSCFLCGLASHPIIFFIIKISCSTPSHFVTLYFHVSECFNQKQMSARLFCSYMQQTAANIGLFYASVNSSSAHPPPPGNPGAFPNVVRPGGGAFAYLGLTPGHLTRGFVTVE